jgi:hypothetical protein
MKMWVKFSIQISCRCPWPLHLTSPSIALAADSNPEQEVSSSSVAQSDEKRGTNL